MADRVVNVNNDGETPDPIGVVTDFDGTGDHPYTKLEFGPSGTQTKVTATTGLPVNPVQETAGVGVGAAADAEAVGDGSVIAILKRIRTLLAGTLTVGDGGGSLTVDAAQLPAALVGGRLDVNVGATALPSVVRRSHRVLDADGPQTDAILLDPGAGNRIVLTAVTVMADGANTADVGCQIGFGATVPAASLAGTNDLIVDASGIKAGGGVQIGSGSGVIALGDAAEVLRLTCEDPVGGALTISYSYYLTT